jgi:hypothetical protein
MGYEYSETSKCKRFACDVEELGKSEREVMCEEEEE